jgi:hypothetical protein
MTYLPLRADADAKEEAGRTSKKECHARQHAHAKVVPTQE